MENMRLMSESNLFFKESQLRGMTVYKDKFYLEETGFELLFLSKILIKNRYIYMYLEMFIVVLNSSMYRPILLGKCYKRQFIIDIQ